MIVLKKTIKHCSPRNENCSTNSRSIQPRICVPFGVDSLREKDREGIACGPHRSLHEKRTLPAPLLVISAKGIWAYLLLCNGIRKPIRGSRNRPTGNRFYNNGWTYFPTMYFVPIYIYIYISVASIRAPNFATAIFIIFCPAANVSSNAGFKEYPGRA